MSTGGIVIGLIITGITLYFLLEPVPLQHSDPRSGNRSYQLTMRELDAQLDLILTGIIDLDFDYDTGKIAWNEYAEQRKMLVGRGVSILIKLDRIEPDTIDIDAAIETAINSRRQTTKTS